MHVSREVSRGDWLYGAKTGYDHWREVVEGNDAWSNVDLSSIKICYERANKTRYWVNLETAHLPADMKREKPEDIEVERVARAYPRKPPCIVPGSALLISTITAATTPGYLALRTLFIIARSPWYGLETIPRLVKMVFLMIGYFFANIACIIESFSTMDPVNSKKAIAEIELEMNDRVGLAQSWWSVRCRQRDFKLKDAGFYMSGCKQSHALARLDNTNKIIGMRTYKGSNYYGVKIDAPFSRTGSAVYNAQYYLDGFKENPEVAALLITAILCLAVAIMVFRGVPEISKIGDMGGVGFLTFGMLSATIATCIDSRPRRMRTHHGHAHHHGSDMTRGAITKPINAHDILMGTIADIPGMGNSPLPAN